MRNIRAWTRRQRKCMWELPSSVKHSVMWTYISKGKTGKIEASVCLLGKLNLNYLMSEATEPRKTHSTKKFGKLKIPRPMQIFFMCCNWKRTLKIIRIIAWWSSSTHIGICTLLTKMSCRPQMKVSKVLFLFYIQSSPFTLSRANALISRSADMHPFLTQYYFSINV